MEMTWFDWSDVEGATSHATSVFLIRQRQMRPQTVSSEGGTSKLPSGTCHCAMYVCGSSVRCIKMFLLLI